MISNSTPTKSFFLIVAISFMSAAFVVSWSRPSLGVTAPVPAAASKERSRLDALFIWKTSEELKLDAPTEQKFTEVIESLNARRRAANLKMDESLAQLSHAKTKAEAEKALNAHRAALREVQATQSSEIDRLRPLLGPEKLAQYITVKNFILEKLKTMLAAPIEKAPQAMPPSATPLAPAPSK